MRSIMARVAAGFAVKAAVVCGAIYVASEVYAFVSHAFAPVAAVL